ncbi:MAG: ABC transporter permease [Coriobacteriia bacterium]|nr:ABC transporter permease [Coriobacteriia bacterium]
MLARVKCELNGVYTIWYRDVLRFFANKSRIVASFGQPMLFLFVFGSGLASAMSGLGGGAVDFRVFMFPGVLGMNVLFAGVFSGISVVWDREFGFLREVMVAPVSRTAVALGKVAGGSTVAMMQGAILLLLAPLIGVEIGLVQALEVFGLLLLLAAVMTSFGLMVAARQKSVEGHQVVMQFLLMPMLFLSGAFFPLEGAPAWLGAVARANPVTYGVDPLRRVMLADTVPPQALDALTLYTVPVSLAVLAAFGAVFLTAAVALFGKRD